MKNILFYSALAAIIVFPLASKAQEVEAEPSYSPIFITPYTQGNNTYNSNIPNIVQAANTSKSSTYTPSARSTGSQYVFKDIGNPYAGSAYGRMTSETSFYDKESKTYVNQYDYMKRLYDRGDMAELERVRTRIQEKGVFDPARYQATMRGQQNDGTSGQQAGQNQGVGGGTVINRSLAVVKKDKSEEIPQKLHMGYDEEPVQKNRPIFLR